MGDVSTKFNTLVVISSISFEFKIILEQFSLSPLWEFFMEHYIKKGYQLKVVSDGSRRIIFIF